MVALQGPASRPILQALCGADPAKIPYHSVRPLPVAGVPCIVCTTGYTGEPGFEILIPAAKAPEVWSAILSAGAPFGLIPCGLAARDSLRAEACLPLYGHEITEETDPFSAGLGRAAVRMEGHDFIGKQALRDLMAAPARRKLVCFRMTAPGVPRQGYPLRAAGRGIGAVTTGLYSPSTGAYVGMGYVEPECTEIGTEISVMIRDEEKPAVIVERPFYKSPHWARAASGAAPVKPAAAPAAPPQSQGNAAPVKPTERPAPSDAPGAAPAQESPADQPEPDEQGGSHAL